MNASATPHLHLELTGHGFGHLAQTAPVIRALRRRRPALRLSVRSALPRAVLADHLGGGFEHIEESADAGGMRMASPVDVLAADSAEAYRRLYADRGAETERLAALYATRSPGLVVANAPWLPLAAARRAGIAAMALCSLDWATVLDAYCGGLPGMTAVLDHLRECYALADPFIRPEPSRTDVDFIRSRAVGPIARLGRDRRRAIRRRLAPRAWRHLVLVGLGGIPTALPLQDWPRLPGVMYVSGDAHAPRRDDWVTREALGERFVDLLASADAVIAKPGYGTFTEAACNGTRVLYSPRPDWPEEPLLSQWLERHVTAAALPRQRLWAGDFASELLQLLEMPVRAATRPTGVEDAAELLESRLQA